MAGPFATATDLAERVGHPAPPDDLARWQAHLETASSLIRGYCHQTLSFVTSDVITVYPTVSTLLTLPERPVTAVSQVLVNGVATTAFYVNPRGIRSGTVASPGSAWLSGATVTYSHGYAETTEEFKLIKGITLNMVQRALFGPQGEVFGPERVEAVGWSAEVYLSEQDQIQLQRVKRGPVR